MKVKFSNFFTRKQGQRDYPYWFFYIIPTLTLSRTHSRQKFSVHLGFLWFNLTLTIDKIDK
jgi:hypothetical protein